jgi:fructokinase
MAMPAFSVGVLDTTGAGDAFTAGLLHGLCQGSTDLERSMRFASACGALVCQGAGAIEPQPTAAQVEAWLAARG